MSTPKPVAHATWTAAVAATAVGQSGQRLGGASGLPAGLTLAAVRSLAAEAYVFAFPLLCTFPRLYQQVADSRSPLYAGGFNRFRHGGEDVPLDDNHAFPCRDTRTSWAWLDLRAEPWVVVVPESPPGALVSVRAVDLLTHDAGQAGPGAWLVAGPGWDGPVPAGVAGVLRVGTRVAGLRARSAMPPGWAGQGPTPLQQALYLVPSSGFAATHPPPPPPPLAFPRWDAVRAHSRDFLAYLNFLLTLCPPHPDEEELLARLAPLGVGPGRPVERGDPALGGALDDGVALAKARLEASLRAVTSTADLYGTREQLGEHAVLKRALGAALGLHGSPLEEEFRAAICVDHKGRPMEGQEHYVLHFPRERLPPARAFWTLTSYALPERTWIDQDHVLDSRRPDLHVEEDGSLVVHLQHLPPLAPANWLPAPAAGPFCVVLRLYWPQDAVLRGRWKAPTPHRVG